MTGRLWRGLCLIALGAAVVALVVTLTTMRSSRDVSRGLETLREDITRQQTEAATAQTRAMATVSQRVTDVSAQAAAGADAAAGITDLATRVADLESDSESYARALEFLDSKYPQAKLDQEVVGKIAESGRFAILEFGVPVGSETYDLYRTDGGYALVAKTERTDGRWGASLSQTLRLDEALRPTTTRIEGMLGARARNERAEIDESEIRLTTATGRVLAERLATEDPVAALDTNFSSPFILLHRAIGTPEENAEVAVGASVQGKAILTLEGSVASLTLRRAEPVSITSPDVRELGYRHDVRVGDEVVARYYVLRQTVIGVEVPSESRFAYRSDLFPTGFSVASRALLDMAMPEGVAEEEVPFSNAGAQLMGTLAAPTSTSGKIPLVLIVPDLGPSDRDGDSIGLQTRVGRELARGLAQRGIASYRYDRRGVGASSGSYEATDLAGLVTDARVALALLRAIAFVDPLTVYAVGIGRGGLVAGMLAASGAVGGAITLSTSSVPLGAFWLAEVERLSAGESLPAADVDLFVGREQAFQDFVRESSGTWSDLAFEEVRIALPWMTELEVERRSAALPLPLLRDLLDVDPLETFRKIAKPTLVVQGDKDPYVPTSNGFALTQAASESAAQAATLSVVTDLNHFLRPHVESIDSGNVHLDKSVDLRVLELIMNWCGVTVEHGAPGEMPSAM